MQATFVEEGFKVPTSRGRSSPRSVTRRCPTRQRDGRNVQPGPASAPIAPAQCRWASQQWLGRLGVFISLRQLNCLPFLSRAVECGGRDPDLRPPRLESFVLRSLYGCVSLNAGPKSVFVPCLGSKWEGSRPRGYITLQRSASLNTTQSGEAQPSIVRVSGTDPGM